MNPFRSRAAIGAAFLLALAIPVTSGLAIAQDEASPVGVEVSGLEPGTVVTENEIVLDVAPVGFEVSAAHAGTPPVDGIGHFHLVLDGGLIDMVTTSQARLSLQNVEPGPHTVMVVPAQNDHSGVMEGAVAIDFDYQPADPLPVIESSDVAGGSPAIEIISPAAGDTVSGPFELTIATTDFELSGDLLGKPNVDGIGHWHVFIDAADGMGTMAGMASGDSFTVDPSALTPGPHTFIAVLVDNLHAPFDPPIAAAVELDVAGADAGSAEASVDVSLTEFSLTPEAIELDAGTFTFTGVNDGSIPHALVIEGEGVRAGTPSSSYGGGQSESFTVELAPGTYEIYCPVPGHSDAGMSGTVVVS